MPAAIQRSIGVRDPLPGVVYPDPQESRAYIEAGLLGEETLPGALRASFARHAERLALDGPGGRITYAELDSRSERLGAALLRTGLAPLDRVVFQLNNCAELVVAWVACLKAGLIPLCTLAAHREHEIGYLAEHAGAKLHFVQGDDPRFDGVEFARRMGDVVPSLRWVLQARGAPQPGVLHLPTLIDAVPEADARRELARLALDPWQVAVFQLSGGTTGVPKIIPRFSNEYATMMRAVADWNGYRADDRLFIPLPMVHNLNMGCCFGPFLLTGGTVLLSPDLQPDTLVDVIRRWRPTWLVLGPLTARIEAAVAAGQIDLSQVRGVITTKGAAQARDRLRAPVFHIFGMTEGVIMLTRPDHPLAAQDDTVGCPVNAGDRVRILRPGTEEDAAFGEDGEPAFKGPYTIRGYYDAEDRNREAFTRDGWYRSGDLMRAVEIEGRTFYQFRGRIKDVVDRGGEKINCEEVETVVGQHPALAAVAMVGMPDPVYGERACAFVIPRPGERAPDIERLSAFLRERGLAKFKWPERIEVVSEFPTTLSGKLSKPRLKQLITERLAAERAAAAPTGEPT